MLEFGEITDIQPDTGYVKVKIPVNGVVTEFIPYMRDFSGSNSQCIPIEINMQVLVGQTSAGRYFCLGAMPNKVDKPYSGSNHKYGVQFSDGTLIEYDSGSKKVTIESVGMVEISGLEIKVTAPVITLEGAVMITGEVSMGAGLALTAGNLAVADGDVAAGGVSLKHHKHGGVQNGGSLTGEAI